MRPPRLFLLLLLALPGFLVAAPGDSTQSVPSSALFRESKPREVRNYIRPCIYLDNFSTGRRDLSGNKTAINTRLGQYTFAQTNIGFYTPLWTHTATGKKDSTDINTFHLLLTFNALGDRPEFDGLAKQHRLYKTGIGLRGIYAFGSRFIFFGDVFTFATGDHYSKHLTQTWRMGGSLIFNIMASPNFSFRAGVTKNFLFGNRLYLPVFGIRIGKLDGKCYFTAQFPRFLAVYFQPKPKFTFSIFTRAYGGLYRFSNKDTLYSGNDSVFQMGYTGIANGVRFDFRPNPNFSVFFSGGVAVRNNVWFYSYSYNPVNQYGPMRHFFYHAKPDPTLFLQFGVSWRFGKSKRSTGNYLMYDVFDLNTSMDAGDNNSMPSSAVSPRYDKAEMKKVQYKDVIDLVDETDLY